ncbi:MAG: glycosyltransferase family 2 protein [Flavobacterium sp.]|nr:MAG: glycosyltransferase family 2 protein [Flavobacterium sp.]
MINNDPLVSVLMTCYNRGRFLAEAIESVLASSYKNFELIIVDDASTDDSLAISQAYAARDTRIKVVSNNKNLGDYKNRNHAASFANGKYIKYVDSDDRIEEKSLEIMVDGMEQNPLVSVGFSPRRQSEKIAYPVVFDGAAALRKHFIGGGLLEAGPASAIIRLDKFNEVGCFSGKRYVSDYECWLKLCLVSSIILFEPGLVWLRTHEGQENDVGRIDYYHLNYNIHQSFLSRTDVPFTERERKDLKYNYRVLLGRRIYQRLLKWYGIKKTLDVVKRCGEGPSIFFQAFSPMKKLDSSIE